MRLRGRHNRVTVDMVSHARAMASVEAKHAMELFVEAMAEQRDEQAAILMMFGAGRAQDAFSWAAFALENAELLGWYPTTNEKSDWCFGAREKAATAA